MRITTPAPRFKDYYDGGMAYGQDQSIVYVRHRHKVEATPETSVMVAPYLNHPSVIILDEHRTYSRWAVGRRKVELRPDETHGHKMVLFFCGKVYPFYLVKLSREEEYFIGKQKHYRTVHEKVYSFDKRFDTIVRDTKADHREFRPWLDEMAGKDDPTVNFHFRSPIVLYDGDGVYDYGQARTITSFEVNTSLQEIGFQRVVDPTTAFQEISMFMSGVLSTNLDPPSPLSDKEKVLTHGLHPTHAFRKLPKKVS